MKLRGRKQSRNVDAVKPSSLKTRVSESLLSQVTGRDEDRRYEQRIRAGKEPRVMEGHGDLARLAQSASAAMDKKGKTYRSDTGGTVTLEGSAPLHNQAQLDFFRK